MHVVLRAHPKINGGTPKAAERYESPRQPNVAECIGPQTMTPRWVTNDSRHSKAISQLAIQENNKFACRWPTSALLMFVYVLSKDIFPTVKSSLLIWEVIADTVAQQTSKTLSNQFIPLLVWLVYHTSKQEKPWRFRTDKIYDMPP